ncbi:hypothetical protein F4811DRAFT_309342 [Daldinia bambusicola]|nr:hypothetical protein F4811DRAFT_309342 [Daldinia bambusicola]
MVMSVVIRKLGLCLITSFLSIDEVLSFIYFLGAAIFSPWVLVSVADYLFWCPLDIQANIIEPKLTFSQGTNSNLDVIPVIAPVGLWWKLRRIDPGELTDYQPGLNR